MPRVRITPGVLRVGTRVDPARTELSAGLAFGAAEADRSASLFGWHVHREDLSAGSAVDALIITGAASDIPERLAALPRVHVDCDGPIGNSSVVLADCDSTAPLSADRDNRIVLWHHTLERFGAEQLNARYHAATGSDMTSDAWLGWFSMKLLSESALRTRSVDATTLLAYIRKDSTAFDGHKGTPLRIDASNHLVQPLYVLRRPQADSGWVVDREVLPRGSRPR